MTVLLASSPAPDADLLLEGADRATWLEERRKGIGSSDIAALMGFGPRSAAAVILDKQGFDLELPDNELLRFGRRMEPLLLDTLQEDYGVPVRSLRKEVLYRSRHDAIALASPDAVTEDGDGVEAKNVNHFRAHEWADGEVPVDYLAQCHWCLGVTGAMRWHVIALVGGHSSRHVVVEKDLELFSDMLAVAHAAWQHVEAGTLPSLDGSAATTRALARRFAEHVEGKACDGGRRLASLIDSLSPAQERRKYWAEEEDRIKNEIRALLGDAEVGLVDGEKVCSYRSYVVKEHVVAESVRRTLRVTRKATDA